MNYALTPAKARWFAMVPGRAEWVLYKTLMHNVPMRNVTAQILACRYAAIGGIALSVLSRLHYTNMPALLGIGISALASCQLHRLTKEFIRIIG